MLYSIACYRCYYGNARDYNNSRNVSRSCNQSCDSTLKYTPSANRIPFTHVTIYGLVPGSFYLFRVTAENGVSRLGNNVTDNYTEVSTSIPKPGNHDYYFNILSCIWVNQSQWGRGGGGVHCPLPSPLTSNGLMDIFFYSCPKIVRFVRWIRCHCSLVVFQRK